MIITREYIMEHKTVKGSWTRDQIVSLGIQWPPRKGWIKSVIGSEISASNAARFEKAVYAKGDKTIKLSPAALKKADADVLKDLVARINNELSLRTTTEDN